MEIRQKENCIVKRQFKWAEGKPFQLNAAKRSMKPQIKRPGRKGNIYIKKKSSPYYLKSNFLISWMKASYVTERLQPAMVTWFTIVQCNFCPGR